MTDWVSICINSCIKGCILLYAFICMYVCLVRACVCFTERPPATPKSVRHTSPTLPQNLKTEVWKTDRNREGKGRDGTGGVRRGQAGANLSRVCQRWIFRRTSHCGFNKFKSFHGVNIMDSRAYTPSTANQCLLNKVGTIQCKAWTNTTRFTSLYSFHFKRDSAELMRPQSKTATLTESKKEQLGFTM